jgi:arylsulfatase A-like enzyme
MPVDEKEARALLALTYGMISFIDDAIGEILAQLETQGLLESTIVVFMSDHGDLGGDHGVMLKRMHHYQGLIRVPTLWVEPDGVLSERDDLVSTIDFPTTILKRAGIQPFNGAMGRDIFSDPEPDGLMIEEQAGQPRPGTSNPLGLRTLVTRTHRMTLSPDDKFGELYDLSNDPDENLNIFEDPNDVTFSALCTLAHQTNDP